jgi:hypothetical protein
MEQNLRFVVATRQDLSWPDLVERWRYIEGLEFDTVWLPDHIVSVLDPEQPLMESWTALAGLAHPNHPDPDRCPRHQHIVSQPGPFGQAGRDR